jgi:hypothetical protein
LGHVLAKSRQHREVRTSLGEFCGYWNDEIALVDGIEDFDGADDLAVCERRALVRLGAGGDASASSGRPSLARASWP